MHVLLDVILKRRFGMYCFHLLCYIKKSIIIITVHREVITSKIHDAFPYHGQLSLYVIN